MFPALNYTRLIGRDQLIAKESHKTTQLNFVKKNVVDLHVFKM